MKNTFKKMVAMMSTMMIAFGCFINKIDSYEAKAANATETTTINADEIEDKVVAMFNEARAELGLEPLYIMPALNDAADVRAAEIVDTYSHVRPDGSSYVTILKDVDFDCLGAGEILLRGSANAKTIFSAWKNSKDHWAIITKPEATHIGISAYFDPDSEKRWHWAAEIVTLPEGYEAEGQRLPESEEAPAPEVQSNVESQNEASADTIIYGDLNFDGMVDCFDVILMTRYLNGTMEFNDAQLAAADMIKDGNVSELDASILKMFILGKIDHLPIV